jgi:hypothetical protein
VELLAYALNYFLPFSGSWQKFYPFWSHLVGAKAAGPASGVLPVLGVVICGAGALPVLHAAECCQRDIRHHMAALHYVDSSLPTWHASGRWVFFKSL